MPCTTVTNFCSKGKVMLLLSMVRCFVLDKYDMDAIAINMASSLAIFAY